MRDICPKNARILHRLPEKYFPGFFFFWGGGNPLPPSPTPMAGLQATHQLNPALVDNHLKLNEEKTQIVWLGTRQQLNKVTARALTLPNATIEY